MKATLLVAMMFIPVSVSGQPAASEISGRYHDEATGVTLVFPDGWRGTMLFGQPVVSPGGVDLKQDISVSMRVVSSPRSSIFDIHADPRPCDLLLSEYIRLNSMNSLHVIKQCGNIKSDVFMVLTDEHLIGVNFSAPLQDYDRYFAEFMQSIATLEIDGADDLQSALISGFGLKTQVFETVVSGRMSEVKITSSSDISDLQFVEDEKRISFRQAESRIAGSIALVSIQNVLEGPFSVFIDGKPAKPIVIEDRIAAKPRSTSILTAGRRTYRSWGRPSFQNSPLQSCWQHPLASLLSCASGLGCKKDRVLVYRDGIALDWCQHRDGVDKAGYQKCP